MRESAGVDCVGLVQRSAGYPGNPYLLPDLSPYTWATPSPKGSRVDIGGQHVTRVSARDEQGAEPENLGRVIPGDIVSYPGHIMMVAQVRNLTGRAMTMEDILLIEATWGNYEGGIGKTNRVIARTTLEWWNASGARWVLSRLSRNQEAPAP